MTLFERAVKVLTHHYYPDTLLEERKAWGWQYLRGYSDGLFVYECKIDSGHSSMHYHQIYDNLFVVTKGQLLVEVEKEYWGSGEYRSEVHVLGTGDRLLVPAYSAHQFRHIGSEQTHLTELYYSENERLAWPFPSDDIIRREPQT